MDCGRTHPSQLLELNNLQKLRLTQLNWATYLFRIARQLASVKTRTIMHQGAGHIEVVFLSAAQMVRLAFLI